MERSRLPPIERVRDNDIIASGGIEHWRNASEWRRQARDNVGKVSSKAGHARTVVRQLFDQLSNTPWSDARVMSGKGGLAAGGNGREAYLLLFPVDLRDEAVVGLYLQDHRDITARREASTLTLPRIKSHDCPAGRGQGGRYRYSTCRSRAR